MSIIWPFQAKAPAPHRACSSKAAMRATASSASAFDGVNSELMTSICPGWMEILPLKPIAKRALLHGHCHQKAFAAMGAVETTLRMTPELAVETVDSSCCGMAGAFGYAASTIDVSLAMGELSLLPAVRKAPADALIVADGTSCRHQIADGTGRKAIHVASVLARAMEKAND